MHLLEEVVGIWLLLNLSLLLYLWVITREKKGSLPKKQEPSADEYLNRMPDGVVGLHRRNS